MFWSTKTRDASGSLQTRHNHTRRITDIGGGRTPRTPRSIACILGLTFYVKPRLYRVTGFCRERPSFGRGLLGMSGVVAGRDSETSVVCVYQMSECTRALESCASAWECFKWRKVGDECGLRAPSTYCQPACPYDAFSPPRTSRATFWQTQPQAKQQQLSLASTHPLETQRLAELLTSSVTARPSFDRTLSQPIAMFSEGQMEPYQILAINA